MIYEHIKFFAASLAFVGAVATAGRPRRDGEELRTYIGEQVATILVFFGLNYAAIFMFAFLVYD